MQLLAAPEEQASSTEEAEGESGRFGDGHGGHCETRDTGQVGNVCQIATNYKAVQERGVANFSSDSRGSSGII